MIEYFKQLFNSLLSQDTTLAYPRAIAKHLAKVQLYQLSGIDALYDPVKQKAEQLIVLMKDKGVSLYITSTIRTAKAQNDLYAQGRTAPGSIVTQAQGLQSYHNFGLAFDVAFDPSSYTDDSTWDLIGKTAESIGLEWGGTWTGFVDKDHFEYHPGFTWHDLETFFKTGRQ